MLIGTLNHVKVKRLKKLLRKPLYCAMGVLESLWQLCMECCDEGNIGKFSNEEIADHIEWEGDADLLISALTESGWLDTCSDERLIVHDWFAHCPEFIRKRIEKRKAREVKKSRKKEDQLEIRTYDEKPGDMSQNSETCPEKPGHVSSISHRIVSNHISSVVCSEDSESPSKPAKQETLSLGIESHVWPHFVVSGEVTNADRAKWTITESQIAEWQKAFPAINVASECRRAHVWVKANWRKRKTYTGYPAFFVTWLSKEQNKASGQQQPQHQPYLPMPPTDTNAPIFVPKDRADRMKAAQQ